MRVVIALPFHGLLGILYAGLAVLLTPFFMFSFVEVLRAVGMHPLAALLLGASVTFLSLATSPVNLVVYTLSRRQYMPVVDYVVVFGIPVPVPRIVFREEKSYIAINVGGAVIPLAVATYLAAHVFSPALLAAVAIASILIYAVSRVVPYVGVVTPALAPPIIAALSALIAGGGPVATYITAVYGTIIGADVLNMEKVLRYKPPFVSIGGAGVFDGIFLSGVLAVLLSKLF
jgi:Predicted membrane protein